MSHNLNPLESVQTNQTTPRVGLWFKQKFDLEFQTRFGFNLAKFISFDL
jgi:hypothetical protein